MILTLAAKHICSGLISTQRTNGSRDLDAHTKARRTGKRRNDAYKYQSIGMDKRRSSNDTQNSRPLTSSTYTCVWIHDHPPASLDARSRIDTRQSGVRAQPTSSRAWTARICVGLTGQTRLPIGRKMTHGARLASRWRELVPKTAIANHAVCRIGGHGAGTVSAFNASRMRGKRLWRTNRAAGRTLRVLICAARTQQTARGASHVVVLTCVNDHGQCTNQSTQINPHPNNATTPTL